MAKSISDVVADSEYLLKVDRPAALLPHPEAQTLFRPVISVDDHVLEPADAFATMPSKLRTLGPRIERGDQDRPLWNIDGKLHPIAGVNGAIGRPMAEWNAASLDYDEFRAGVGDVDQRVLDMDLNGVWASLLFPSVTFGFAGRVFFDMADPIVGLAALRAYNDWMLDRWCAAYPERFIACQLSWMPDPVTAAADVRRNADRGFRAVSFSENPEGLGLPSIYTDFWDPFFAACQETGTIVNLHVGSSGVIHQPSVESPREVRVALFPVNGIETLIDWLYSRVPARFPDLRVVLSEAGISWVPMAFERIAKMHKQAAVTGNWTAADGDPLDRVRNTFRFTSIEDPAGFRLLDVIGEDSVMVEVDYPHGDSTWPRTQALLRRDFLGLNETVVDRLCFANAADLYRHPVPTEEWTSRTAALSGSVA
jgi:predicted TIM-barrel fold metal-dependent hydrolase